MNTQGVGSVEADCAGGCGTKVRRHPEHANRVSFFVCSPKCRGIANSKLSVKISDEDVIKVQMEFLSGAATKKSICSRVGISAEALNKRVRKLREQGMKF